MSSSPRTIFTASRFVRADDAKCPSREYARAMEPAPAANPDRRIRRSDWLIAAGVAVIAQIEVWATQTGSPKVAYAVAALAMSVPLAWRRPAPIVVLVVVFVPLFAMKLAGDPVESAYVTAVA